jgi:hypothetical protein
LYHLILKNNNDEKKSLRELMIGEMQIRNYSPRTINAYVSLLAGLARYYDSSPDELSTQQFKDYLAFRVQTQKVSVSTVNQLIGAWKLLQTDVLNREWESFMVKRLRKEKKLPVVLSRTEALKLINALYNLNPRFWGAQTGAVALLHTWSQTLMYHPHIHMIVPAGGLSEDNMEWISSGIKFFVPIKVIGKIFRGILCRYIETGIKEGDIKLPENQNWEKFKNQLYEKNWIIYAQKPLGGVNSVLQYLGRYSHRVAIANSRIIQVEQGNVSFCYKDNKNHGFQKSMTIPALEFIRRFMQHILPDNFYKIRYYGIMAAVHTQTLMEQCLALLGKVNAMPVLEGLSAMEAYREITGKDPFQCPACRKGRMMILQRIPVPDI